MAVIERRVFYGKPGKADEIVAVCQQFIEMMEPMGNVRSSRVMTDHLSGRTDRVVMEMEADSLGAIESDMTTGMEDPEIAKKFGSAFSKLTDLITHAEVDYWTVR